MTLMNSSLVYQVAPFEKSGDELRPGMLLLHGRGADEEDLMGLVPHLNPRIICFAPRAPFSFPYGGFMWYDLQEIAKPNPEQFEESYQRLMHLVDNLQREYPVDPHRMFLLGFSMGAVMAYALAMTRPERFHGVIAHSGYMPEHFSAQFLWHELSQTSFFIAHGIYDPVIPIEFGRSARDLLTKSNALCVYREYPIQHQISDESLRDLAEWLNAHIDFPS